MPANNTRSKRKSERKPKSTKPAKVKKTAEPVINEIQVEDFENGCDVVSSILEESRKSNDKMDDEIVSISSDTLLCLEDVYCDTNSTSQAMSPISNWGSEMNSVTLVIGDGDEAMILKNKIQQLTSGHEVQVCKQMDCFDMCNNRSYVLVWLMMNLPVGQDILSITTSIRYASKCNRGTVIIGISKTNSTVDLRLHGIDEIVIQPVEDNVIRQKYSKWTSVSIIPADVTTSFENPHTPMSTSPVLSSTDPNCGLSMTVDNSGGQLSIASLGGLIKCTTATIGPAFPGKNRHGSSSLDHTTKEKVRRERIKDSCDQLRVLLPYIRGRKTDMASILEMCVDYIKLVNAALPQDFQNQIVEILAKDSVIVSPGPKEKNKNKKPETDLNTVSSTVDTDINNNEIIGNSTGTQPTSSEPVKIDSHDPLMSVKSSKRYRMQVDNFLSAPTSCISNAVAIAGKGDTTMIDQQQPPTFSFNGAHQTLYSEYDHQNLARPFTAHEAYPNSFYGSALATKQNILDRDSFGMFMDSQQLYQFYGTNSLCPYSIAPITDYVNPNAILPITYNSCKQNLTTRTFDDQNKVVSTQQGTQQQQQTDGMSKE